MNAFKIGNWDSENIKINLPYIDYDKSLVLQDLIKSCEKLKIDSNKILKNTLTSYNPDKDGISDGCTGSDIERILAFHKLGFEDPIKYSKSWKLVLKNALTTVKV